MPPLADTLKQLAEDAYLLASNFHTGNDEYLLENMGELPSHEIDAHREWRMIEMIVGLGDRACALAGLDPQNDVWVPDDLKNLVG